MVNKKKTSNASSCNAKAQQKASADPEKLARIMDIRRQIRQGSYDTIAKMDILFDRLLTDLL